jgi:hypothetical protein
VMVKEIPVEVTRLLSSCNYKGENLSEEEELLVLI